MPFTRRDFVRSLFAASQTALVGRMMAAPIDGGDKSEAALRFAVIGDWGRQGRPDQRQVAEQMAIACKKAAASFIVSVGDNFYERGVTSLEDDHWQKSFEEVYSAPSLQVRWNVILGNHDYAGNCQPQLEYGKAHPRWNMSSRYYMTSGGTSNNRDSFSHDFFYLDTCPFIDEYRRDPKMFTEIPAQDPYAQLRWLERSLAASKADWKLVFGHHPIYSSGLAHGNQPEMIEYILPLLQKYKVQAYFAGHDHDLEHLKVGNLDLIVSGAGSEHRPVKTPATSPFSTATSGFALAFLTAHEMQVQFIDSVGTLLYTAIVSRRT
jgi:tartrate-resistant acid phosphatase type 5